MSQTKIKPNCQVSLDSSTHWYADEENGITTDGKRFYCPKYDELKAELMTLVRRRDEYAKAYDDPEKRSKYAAARLVIYNDLVQKFKKWILEE